MYEGDHILLIGAAGLDIKALPQDNPADFLADTEITGRIRNSVGGVARNIAENLAHLEMPALLLTVIGDDASGRRVYEKAAAAGVDMSEVLTVTEARTGMWLGILEPGGALHLAVADYEIMAHLKPRYLYDRRRLFADASMVVLDANLSKRALRSIFKLAARYDLKVCADPTSARLAGRLRKYLDRLYMVVPNIHEATALCEVDIAPGNRDAALQAARRLVALGVQIAVVTMGETGLVYATSESSGHIPALYTEVVDTTGAGDACSAGIIFGLLNDIPLDEAMRLGVAAASLTLRSPETVTPNLSLELLYDQLV